ncbi:MAG TPA: hypothetical protein VF541_19455 [Longimicrobium sp.]
MPYACPDCGAPVSERAAVCPQCGFPIRRDGVPGPGGRPGAPPSSNRATVLIVVLVAGGLLMVMVIGVLAALAIPRFSQASRSAKELEGAALLKQAYTLEQTYRAEKGMYASRLDDLREVGWEPPPATYYYDVQVSTANDQDLCLEAVPRPSAAGQVRALSMDAGGHLYHDAGCAGAPAVDIGVDSRRGEQAEDLVRRGWRRVGAFRQAHGGRLPAGLTELGPELEAEAARRDYRIGYFRIPGGGYCLTARPLSTVEGPERSVNEDGELYTGSACRGTLIERLDAEPGASPAAEAEAPSDAENPSSDLDFKPKP